MHARVLRPRAGHLRRGGFLPLLMACAIVNSLPSANLIGAPEYRWGTPGVSQCSIAQIRDGNTTVGPVVWGLAAYQTCYTDWYQQQAATSCYAPYHRRHANLPSAGLCARDLLLGRAHPLPGEGADGRVALWVIWLCVARAKSHASEPHPRLHALRAQCTLSIVLGELHVGRLQAAPSTQQLS